MKQNADGGIGGSFYRLEHFEVIKCQRFGCLRSLLMCESALQREIFYW